MGLTRLIPYALCLGAAGGGYLVHVKSQSQQQGAVVTWGPDGGPDAGVPLKDLVPSRAQQLSRLRASSPDQPFDLLVVGGGATGCGIAVDAATRWVGGRARCRR